MSRPPVRRLILLRHGQTEWNATDRMQGQLDTELTELGRTQAKEAARELSTTHPLRIVTSDLRRAVDTATVLGELAAALGVRVDPVVGEQFLQVDRAEAADEDDRGQQARPLQRRDYLQS